MLLTGRVFVDLDRSSGDNMFFFAAPPDPSNATNVHPSPPPTDNTRRDLSWSPGVLDPLDVFNWVSARSAFFVSQVSSHYPFG